MQYLIKQSTLCSLKRELVCMFLLLIILYCIKFNKLLRSEKNKYYLTRQLSLTFETNWLQQVNMDNGY